MRLSIVVIVLLLSGCASRSYVPAPATRQNVNGGLQGLSVDIVEGRCEVIVVPRGDSGRYHLKAPFELCERLLTAQTILNTVPRAPVPPPQPPKE